MCEAADFGEDWDWLIYFYNEMRLILRQGNKKNFFPYNDYTWLATNILDEIGMLLFTGGC